MAIMSQPTRILHSPTNGNAILLLIHQASAAMELLHFSISGKRKGYLFSMLSQETRYFPAANGSIMLTYEK